MENDIENLVNKFSITGEYSVGAASILADLGMDADTVVAALVMGSAGSRPSAETVERRFGAQAALLVKGVEKISRLSPDNKSIHEAHNIRNMLFAMTEDIRVILIRLAEKLHALREMAASPDEERKAAAQECLDIYAPLADRLGISRIKDEMEDLYLKYLNREAYQQIKELVAEKLDARNQFLEDAQKTIKEEAAAAGIPVEVKSRAKHFYSVYMKMRKRGVSADKIYDLSGIRIICENVENCYTLLGIVHRLWKPLSGCFKDYIAMPKANGYQSLHTSVMAETFSPHGESVSETAAEGRRLEIQIRTREMHEIAENGIASHWLYKKGSSRDLVQHRDLSIVGKLKNWKRQEGSQAETSGAWLEEIKREILSDSIYVFTPQGKVIELPTGATPIDFAYHIHTAIGEHCAGAKANGSIIQLSAALKNTQVVEILTSVSAHPHLNWLSVVKTAKAKSKIRLWLERNDESFAAEKAPAENVKPSPEPLEPLPAAAGEFPPVQNVIHPGAGVLRVTVEDEKNMMVRFARCCNPIPGDSIIGYVSRGRGVIIHRDNCSNLANIPEFEERKIEAEWENAASLLVRRFRVEARPSANMFSEIESVVRKRNGHLIEGRLEENSASRLSGFFTVQLMQEDDLKAVVKNIRGIPGIITIQAVN